MDAMWPLEVLNEVCAVFVGVQPDTSKPDALVYPKSIGCRWTISAKLVGGASSMRIGVANAQHLGKMRLTDRPSNDPLL